MTHKIEGCAQRVYFGIAVALMAVLIVTKVHARPQAGVSEDGGPPKTALSIEELELRIRALEKKLESEQQSPAATQPAAAARQPTSSAQETVATTQQSIDAVGQAGTTNATGSTQIYAGPSGFSFKSADGASQIRFHGEFDFDGRFFNGELTPDGSRSTWLLRRARPIIEGTFANIFDFRFNPDFAGGKTVIQDAFVAARFNPLFIVTAGKFKEPFGLERLQLSPNNRFIELGLPSDLVPNRDLGVQIAGAYAGGKLTYQIGYFNGVSDGVSTDANAMPDIDNNDQKDWAARLFAQPFLKNGSALQGLGVGFAVTYVNQVGTPSNTLLPTYKTETQRSFFSYDGAVTTTAGKTVEGATIADGKRLRMSPQGYYYYRSFGLLSEYVRESQDVSRRFGIGTAAFTRAAKLTHDSWQATATYLVSGEDASFGTVTPKRPFAVGQLGWGALELAARISQLKLDLATVANPAATANVWFADPSAQAHAAIAWTLGVNWYLNPNIAWYLDYTVTRFAGGAPARQDRADEKGFFTRFQVAF